MKTTTSFQIPKASLVTSNLLQKKNRRFKTVVALLSALIMLTIVNVAGDVMAVLSKPQKIVAPTPVKEKINSTISAIGLAVAKAWLTGQTPPVPLGTSVATTNSPALSYTGLYFADQKERTVTIKTSSVKLFDNTYLLTTATGNYNLAVSIEQTPTGYAVLGSPSLSPAIIPVGTSVLDGQNYSAYTLTPTITQAIDSWAAAYVTNNTQSLYLLSGDSKAQHFFGLTGWELTPNTTPNISSSYQISPSEAIVQISIPITSTSSTPTQVVASYDLLLSGLTKSVPYITAWGPIGSGTTLTPYQNALPGIGQGSG